MTGIRRLWAVVCAAVFLGCADGGPVGTGISSSSISGNVVEVQAASAGSAGALPAPVQVSIDEAPGIEDTTDADGHFELEGEFSGPITLRFRAAEVTATEQLDVAAGSTTILDDVAIVGPTAKPTTIRQLGFYGHVAMVDCAGNSILVNDRKAAANQFLVRLTADTAVFNKDGQPIDCATIAVGSAILIDGVIRLSDRTVIGITLIVGPPPTDEPTAVQLRFRGTVAVVNCEQGNILLMDDAGGQTRLRLSPLTFIANTNQQRLRCRDISVGDHVVGRGLKRRPGVLDATALTVTAPLQP